MKKIAIFASGSGTNAQNVFDYFKENNEVICDSLWSNNVNSYALTRAENYGVKTFVFNRDEFKNTDRILETLKERGIDLIVLAGFLWLIPENLLDNFAIINIHPALLPKYGGKGMYGSRVHEAVIKNGDTESGITIHYVNEVYDAGKPIFQAKCVINSKDTAEDVAQKVHNLEYIHFPKIIEQVLLDEGK